MNTDLLGVHRAPRHGPCHQNLNPLKPGTTSPRVVRIGLLTSQVPRQTTDRPSSTSDVCRGGSSQPPRSRIGAPKRNGAKTSAHAQKEGERAGGVASEKAPSSRRAGAGGQQKSRAPEVGRGRCGRVVRTLGRAAPSAEGKPVDPGPQEEGQEEKEEEETAEEEPAAAPAGVREGVGGRVVLDAPGLGVARVRVLVRPSARVVPARVVPGPGARGRGRWGAMGVPPARGRCRRWWWRRVPGLLAVPPGGRRTAGARVRGPVAGRDGRGR